MIKNIIKEDFYRLKYSKTIWICLAVILALAILMSVFLNFAFDLVGEIDESFSQISDMMSPEAVTAGSFSNLGVSFFCMIFASVLVAGEFSGGTLRQIVASGAGRPAVFFSKWLKIFVASAITLFVGALFTFLTALIFWKSDSSLAGYVLRNIGFQLVALLGYTSLYVALAFLLRSVGGVIGVGIGVNVLVGIIVLPVSLGGGSGFFDILYKLTLTGAVENITAISLATSDILFALLVPLGYTALFGVIGMLNFVKRDIK